jgi:HisJ family histidinol phosphate phosphatase
LSDNSHRRDARIAAIPDNHGHAKGEHKAYAEERPIPYSARMLFLWFYHACRRGYPRFMMVADHMNYLTFEDPAAVNLVRRALKLAQAGDLYGAADTASVEVGHAAVVSEGLHRGMRFSIGAEVDNDPRSRPDAQNIVDAMRPDAMIRSVHFLTIEHPTAGPNYNWPFDNPEFQSLYEHVGTQKTWELYIEALLRAIEELPGQIIGHFYVPAKFGHWPERDKLEQYEDRVVAAAKAKSLAIEFNTRFLYRTENAEERQRYLEANKRLLRKCRDAGVMISVGSDAHSPKDQAGAFDEVLRLLDELDINEIAFPIAGRLARVALRVVQPELPPPPVEKRPARAGAGRKTPVPARPAGRPAPARKDKEAKPPAKPATKAPASKAPASKAPATKALPAKKAAPPPKAAAAKKAAPAAKPAQVAKKAAPAKKAPAKKTTSPAKKMPAAKKIAAKKPASTKRLATKRPEAKKTTAKKTSGKRRSGRLRPRAVCFMRLRRSARLPRSATRGRSLVSCASRFSRRRITCRRSSRATRPKS